MYCKKCGFEIGDNSKFCGKCGAMMGNEQTQKTYAGSVQANEGTVDMGSQPFVPKQKKKKGLLIALIITGTLLLLAIATIVGLVVKNHMSATETFQGEGYSEPEEVAEAYIEAYQAGDLEAMLSCFAIESYVEAYDVEAYVELAGSYSYSQDYTMSIFPAESGEYQETLAVYNRVGVLTEYLYISHLSTYKPELYNDGMPIFVYSDEAELDMNDIMEILEDTEYVAVMEEMDIVEYYTPKDFLRAYDEDAYEYYISAQYSTYMSELQERYGVEELEEICVVVELDGEEYVLMMQLGCYNDKWYITQMGGNVANMMGIALYSQGMCPMDGLLE